MIRNANTALIAIITTSVVLASCAPSQILVETNYEVDQPHIASVGSEMLVIEKTRRTSGANRFLQYASNVIETINFHAACAMPWCIFAPQHETSRVIVTFNFIGTLTYTGKSESNIRVAYREYSGVNKRAVAEPAFYLDLEYPIEDDGPTIITFRDIQMEVIEATGSYIQFKVLGDHGLNWLPELDSP